MLKKQNNKAPKIGYMKCKICSVQALTVVVSLTSKFKGKPILFESFLAADDYAKDQYRTFNLKTFEYEVIDYSWENYTIDSVYKCKNCNYEKTEYSRLCSGNI